MKDYVELGKFEIVQLGSAVDEMGLGVYEVPIGVAKIKALDFWEKGRYGEGVKIAILDTGCNMTHPNLKKNIIGGRNFTSDDGGNVHIYEDYNGHGTHIAGTIGASLNFKGMVGLAPWLSHMSQEA